MAKCLGTASAMEAEEKFKIASVQEQQRQEQNQG
jgi:hypothetical protein